MSEVKQLTDEELMAIYKIIGVECSDFTMSGKSGNRILEKLVITIGEYRSVSIEEVSIVIKGRDNGTD